MERAKSAKLFSLGALFEAVTICELSPRARVLSSGDAAAAKAFGSTGAASAEAGSVGALLAIGSGAGTLGSLCRLSAKLAKVNLSEWTSLLAVELVLLASVLVALASVLVLLASVLVALGAVGLGVFEA